MALEICVQAQQRGFGCACGSLYTGRWGSKKLRPGPSSTGRSRQERFRRSRTAAEESSVVRLQVDLPYFLLFR